MLCKVCKRKAVSLTSKQILTQPSVNSQLCGVAVCICYTQSEKVQKPPVFFRKEAQSSKPEQAEEEEGEEKGANPLPEIQRIITERKPTAMVERLLTKWRKIWKNILVLHSVATDPRFPKPHTHFLVCLWLTDRKGGNAGRRQGGGGKGAGLPDACKLLLSFPQEVSQPMISSCLKFWNWTINSGLPS